MAQTVSDFILERLGAWGVQRIFGYPGDGINGLMGALNRSREKIPFIQVRHEESAAFMACAHAKFTGQAGVCLATSGPGAIHLLNGLYDAKLDHQPAVAIIGQQRRSALGGSYQQEVDLLSLFKDVANEYVHMCTDPSQVRHLVDRAFRIALSERTVTCIILPNDIQEMDYEAPPREHGTVHSAAGYHRPHIVPHHADLQKAAAVLNEGQRVAILVGAGAANASAEVIEIADLLGAGVAKALLGKDVLQDDLPYVTGAIGLLGTKPSWDLMAECDTLLMIGSGFPYSEFLPKEGQARGVQIDIDGRMLGIRYPMEVLLHGDSKTTLRALLPLIQRKKDRSWREQIEKETAKWWKVLEARSKNEANPINPQKAFWELSRFLPENTILTGDSGSTAAWFARDLRIRCGMKASLSGNLATMGSAVPYAIAAKFAYPERMVVATVGDGAMQMQGINELITIAKYWKEWASPRMLIVVLNNRDLNMVTWEQRALSGDPKFAASQDIPDFPYAQYANMLGLEGIKADKPEMIIPALEQAMDATRPVLLEVVADPDVPMLPPHITQEQRRNFFAALVKGDSEAWDIIKQTYKELVDG
ncbi:thiamine pyrophosphate-requiring protein [Chitinophaga agrisoli]|uniref:Thiamine pyrophosphate-requiring protein n=1 Tax=Chitinophaga agrisoli TaxID=2607653 RepID=A0A5B2VWC4_9BACT|nr:thiamine pyrophosphate-requiring protein [Chitinophaga agrisoli]KAA2243044.1 thiamine pyrophosphate-requiring protein [Chitinophaga agrisoli]